MLDELLGKFTVLRRLTTSRPSGPCVPGYGCLSQCPWDLCRSPASGLRLDGAPVMAGDGYDDLWWRVVPQFLLIWCCIWSLPSVIQGLIGPFCLVAASGFSKFLWFTVHRPAHGRHHPTPSRAMTPHACMALYGVNPEGAAKNPTADEIGRELARSAFHPPVYRLFSDIFRMKIWVSQPETARNSTVPPRSNQAVVELWLGPNQTLPAKSGDDLTRYAWTSGWDATFGHRLGVLGVDPHP